MAVHSPAVQHEPDPVGHFAGASVHCAGGSDVVEVSVRDRTQYAADHVVRRGYVARRVQSHHRSSSVAHAERYEQALAQEPVPGQSGHFGEERAGGGVHGVLIGIARARCRRERLIPEPPYNVIDRSSRRIPDHVHGAEPGAVCEHVPDGRRRGDRGIDQLKTRKMAHDRIVPGDSTGIDEHS